MHLPAAPALPTVMSDGGASALTFGAVDRPVTS
jgi:hypothetical protein